MQVIIGVDIGTSSAKVVVYSSEGMIIFRDALPCTLLQTSQEKAEQDPAVVLQSVNELLKKAFGFSTGYNVVGVCFSAAMHSLIAVDKSGNCITNAMLWGDTRSTAQDEKLKQTGIAALLYTETGVPVHPALPFCKIIWLRENSPDVFEQADKFISLKEYIFYHLFGKYIVDNSIAAASGLQNLHTLQWSELALQTAGISKDRLSAIVPVTHAEKTLKQQYKTQFGLTKEIPFFVGSSDGCLANIGTGVFSNTEAALTIGTSGAVRTTGNRPLINDSPTLFCYPLTEDIYIRGGAVNNGGYVLRWFSEQLLDQPLVSYEAYSDFVDKAHTVAAGAEGLIFLPYLRGERAPVWDAKARGVFFGLNSLHKQEHLMRAVMEGINYALYDVFCEMTVKEDRIESIYVSGGFVQSEKWVQMIADIFNKKIVVTDVADASAIGAAWLGLYAAGIIPQLDVLSTRETIGNVYLPDAANHARYQKQFIIFRSVYHALRKEFAKLTEE